MANWRNGIRRAWNNGVIGRQTAVQNSAKRNNNIDIGNVSDGISGIVV